MYLEFVDGFKTKQLSTRTQWVCERCLLTEI